MLCDRWHLNWLARCIVSSYKYGHLKKVHKSLVLRLLPCCHRCCKSCLTAMQRHNLMVRQSQLCHFKLNYAVDPWHAAGALALVVFDILLTLDLEVSMGHIVVFIALYSPATFRWFMSGSPPCHLLNESQPTDQGSVRASSLITKVCYFTCRYVGLFHVL